MTPERINQSRDEIQAYHRMSFEERFLAGAVLFDRARETALSNIRSAHPRSTDGEVLREFRRRLDIAEHADTQRQWDDIVLNGDESRQVE
ncbi:MAG: hypothetical protein H7Z14_00910 [Anaerolineae bacterium]|nr:hypothetical protein [Phycisphaerae bacterium]